MGTAKKRNSRRSFIGLNRNFKRLKVSYPKEVFVDSPFLPSENLLRAVNFSLEF